MKKFSSIMSFVAIIASAAVLTVAIIQPIGHIHETPSQGSVNTETPLGVSNAGRLKTHNGYLIGNPPEVSVPLPSVLPPPAYRRIVNDIPQVPVETGSNPVTGTIPNVSWPSVQSPERLYDPNSAYTFALGDLLTIPESERKYIRYISLYNIPQDRRREYAAVVSWMVNSLSTRRRIYIPDFVGASNESLIRLDIRNYEWTPEAWDKLGSKGSGVRPFPEPYFHIILEKPIIEKKKIKKEITKTKKVFSHYNQFGQPVWKDQQFKETHAVVEDAADRRVFKADPLAPWLDPLAVQTLVKNCCSDFPMFRADWFLVNVSVAPAYYDFLKLGKKAKDFDNLVFANDELAAKARSQDKAVVVTSMVARNNRTLNRSPTFTGGYYWVSHDTLKSVDDRNYVQFILDEKFDATEDIGTLPNGLQAYFLTDGQGNRLDFANPDIAIDNTAVDRIVRTGRSCMVCHADGIRPLNDEIRALTRKLQNREQIQLLIANKKDAYRIEDLFGSDLDAQIIKDQNIYREAVARASGLQSEVIARVFNSVYNWYAEDLVTAETLARDVGINFNELQAYIRASKDNLILGLIKTPVRPIRRDQWEASFTRFMILIMARKQGLDHADPYPPGPLISLPKSKP